MNADDAAAVDAHVDVSKRLLAPSKNRSLSMKQPRQLTPRDSEWFARELSVIASDFTASTRSSSCAVVLIAMSYNWRCFYVYTCICARVLLLILILFTVPLPIDMSYDRRYMYV